MVNGYAAKIFTYEFVFRSLRLSLLSLAVILAGCASTSETSIRPEASDDRCFGTLESTASSNSSRAPVAEEAPILLGGLSGLARRTRYPTEARRRGFEGKVCLQFVVSEEGAVENVTVTRSAHPLLDAEAVRAVRASRFTPGRRDGVPVRVRFSLPVQFRLRGRSDLARTIGTVGAVTLAVVTAYFLLVVPTD